MSRNSVTDLLFTLRCKGTTVWADNGQLRYHATKQPLTNGELQTLRTLRAEIISLLQQANSISTDTEPKLAPRTQADTVPLSFSQRWWWNGLKLRTKPSMRGVCAAVRLSGKLNIECLRRSFTELVRRHESLRTRIIASNNGVLTQHIDDAGEPSLEMIDLSRLPRSTCEAEVKLLAEQIVNEPFSVSEGPLFSARLLKFGDFEHLLVVALDHMISDGASLGILWRDLFTLYGQVSRHLPCSLTETSIQFADYAVWQQSTHQWWMNKHGAYWKQLLAGAEPVQLFPDEQIQKLTFLEGTLPIQLNDTLSSALRESGRRAGTTTVMSVLTAYAASILRLTHRTDLVVPFTTVGRLHPEVENTIGFFGVPTFLRIQLQENNSFLDLLEHITGEYGEMYQHQDSCRIAMQLTDPDVMWNPHFNWIPKEFNTNFAGDNQNYGHDFPIKIEPYTLDIDSRTVEWGVRLGMTVSDTQNGIKGMLGYRTDMFTLNSMKQLLQAFQSCAEALAFDPSSRVTGASCE